jgi:hypothetical protein
MEMHQAARECTEFQNQLTPELTPTRTTRGEGTGYTNRVMSAMAALSQCPPCLRKPVREHTMSH